MHGALTNAMVMLVQHHKGVTFANANPTQAKGSNLQADKPERIRA
ncbi:hypothetical protein Hdeb2414_s0023g00637011 [Helianthus debilis subsp. tardiflorus]